MQNPLGRPLFLDYNSTTPVDPEVLDAMLVWLRGGFGNPSSQHALGRAAQQAVENARDQVANLLGARAPEIIFTSGGTESTNLALKGLASARSRTSSLLGKQLLYPCTEHPATTRVAGSLSGTGLVPRPLPVSPDGTLELDVLADALQVSTLALSLMHANNETGVVQPVPALAKLARSSGAVVHVDAAQAIGKIPVKVDDLNVDLLTLAGHKLYAPKGIGALYIRAGVEIDPIMHGAGQERGLRAGTENVPYIVGLGVACELAGKRLSGDAGRLLALRERLWERLSTGLVGQVILNGARADRLPNTLNVSFRGATGAQLLAGIPTLAASTGAACHDGSALPSPVLTAMGIDAELANGAVRLSIGWRTTPAEIDTAAALLIEQWHQLRRHPHRS